MIGKGFWQKRYVSKHTGKEIDEAVDAVQAGVFAGKYFTDLTYSTSGSKMVLTTEEYANSDAAHAALADIFNKYQGIEYTIDDEMSVFNGMVVRCNFTTCTTSKVDGLGYGTASVNSFLALMTGAIYVSGDKYVIKYEVGLYELE